MRGSHSKNRNQIRAFILLISLSLALVSTYSVSAALDLLYFEGQGQDGAVLLEWKTATEVNARGFYVTRSDTEDGNYSRISNLIAAVGNSSGGAYYTYLDTNVYNGRVYWYQLEAVDDSMQSTFSQKIQVLVGSPTQTPTPTATSLLPGTATPTGNISAASSTPTTPTPTGLASAIPSKMSTPGVGLTATPGIIPESTQTISTTATLIPLPEITLQFPTPPTNPGDLIAGAAVVQQKSSEGASNTVMVTIGRVIFLGFIVLIWLVLAAWFYIASKRLE